MKYYIYLALAICSEVFGSTMLKLSEGFTILYPSIGVAVGFAISFLFLGWSLKGLPLSTAYGIWAGLGTAFTAITGVIIFEEVMHTLKVTALFLIIIGVFMLNQAQGNDTNKKKEVASY